MLAAEGEVRAKLAALIVLLLVEMDLMLQMDILVQQLLHMEQPEL
jgi:hypothetical protein